MPASEVPSERIAAGTRLGPYEIVGFLGAGGMGTVYRGRDTRLARDVALKVLPRRTSDGVERHARFLREARVLSSLNHPNVCAIYDIGESHGRAFLVMELVDGERLDLRLARRPPTVGEAIDIGIQVADALDAAHRRGFVHLDLKPGNIILTPAGVKLLDFGIARLWTEPLAAADQLDATTASDHDAFAGTTAYSSPEQLEGRAPDPRSDLFAFGVVLYEMLEQKRPFTAESKAGLIAAILEHPPAAMRVGRSYPPGLERVIEKCLHKDPERRWQTARDLSSELTWIAHGRPEPEVVLRPASRRKTVGLSAVALSIAAAAFIGARSMPIASTSPPPVARFMVNPPPGLLMAGTAAFAISPDGRHLVFAGSANGGPRMLWLQALDAYSGEPIRGTEEAWHPFWSPDGRSIGFFAGQKLKAVNRADGIVRTIADLPLMTLGVHGAWGDGVILFTVAGSLFKVPAGGGEPIPITTRDSTTRPAGVWHRFLPNGRHFLFKVNGTAEPAPNLFVGSIDDDTRIPLLRADSQVDYVDPGYLLFVRNGDLIAHPFDAGTLRISGTPVNVPEAVPIASRLNRAIFAASRSGVLAYEAYTAPTQLTWYNRAGHRLGVLGRPGTYLNPSLSPDGRRVLVSRLDPSTNALDIWVIGDGIERQVTAERGTEDYPLWSADGERVLFASDRTGQLRIYEKDADSPAAANAQPLFADSVAAGDSWPADWGAGGRWILFQGGGGGLPRRLFALQYGVTRTPAPVFPEAAAYVELQEAGQAQISPDGRWIAYVVGLGRSPQVHVRSFADSSVVLQISTAGGFEPKWRGDGRELFFLTPDRTLMSVGVSCLATCTLGAPRPLFRVPGLGAPLRKGTVRNEYAVARDGEKFIINEPVDTVSGNSLRIVFNWPSALRQ